MKEPLASPVASCPECGKLRAALNEALGQLDKARKQIADLQAEIHELRSQLNRNSSNSSSPPSVDPPGAPKPVIKTPTGRSQAVNRGILDTIAVASPRAGQQDRAVCAYDLRPLPSSLARRARTGDPEPTWHQVAELPELAAIITEHQGHARTCPCCGHLNRGEIPRRSAPMSSGHAWPR